MAVSGIQPRNPTNCTVIAKVALPWASVQSTRDSFRYTIFRIGIIRSSRTGRCLPVHDERIFYSSLGATISHELVIYIEEREIVSPGNVVAHGATQAARSGRPWASD
jgi:hypothetical protein